MILTDERINHLSHLLLNTLKTKGGAAFPDEAKFLNGIKKSIHQFEAVVNNADIKIRQKIGTLKRQIPEGSREWDLLYRQYFEEELAKKGL
ncbi:MAG: DUF507 family protein [Deltaproteobacteria bacterium]|nr:DUF507 family protein [Deltaproteobacteria bacterium]